ncbi:hypothetical protein pVco14_070 [Vibrio phage pVco-14]|nr:hypothetical protein pVco14_070 [Vibrio phage pVco-14]
MTTKQMHAHLSKSGCAFTKTDQGYWECSFDGELVSDHRQLGQLVWIAARKLGED